jgi:hypothetical protein
LAVARKHHYVPRFFLAGFTSDGTKEGRLLVCDLRTGKRWWSDPNGAGHQRDFYRIDLQGYDPLEVEKAFQEIEAAAAPALRRFIGTEAPPPLGETVSEVLPLLASLVIRVPTARRRVESASRRVVRATFPKVLPNLPKPPPELHSRIFGHLPPGTDPTPEDYEASMMRFFNEELQIEIDQTWSIGHMLSAFELVLDRLARLHWTVAVLQAGAPDFVSSDNPVSFRGAASMGVIAVIAISRRMALVGSLYEPEHLVIHPDGRFAELVNGLTIGGAEQFVFSSSEQVLWKREDGSRGNIADFPSRAPR